MLFTHMALQHVYGVGCAYQAMCHLKQEVSAVHLLAYWPPLPVRGNHGLCHMFIITDPLLSPPFSTPLCSAGSHQGTQGVLALC